MASEGGRIIIRGITSQGRKFRPSDWAQRLTTAVATQDRSHHIHFHPKVHMATIGGVNCVVVEASLQDGEPMLFDFLMNFGRNNDLQIETVKSGEGATAG